MTLDKAEVGELRTIVGMDLTWRMERRLAALGVTPGTQVSVLNRKDGGTMILKVRGTRLAMGRGITRGIEVA